MTWAYVLLGLALVPAGLFLINLAFFPKPRRGRSGAGASPSPAVSVLIPVRDEAATIARSLQAVLAQTGVDFEVLVLDDHSSDRTAEIVREFAARDYRVRLLTGAPLPPGWCGKQHACWQLALSASKEVLVFVDADVTLEPDALAALGDHFATHSKVQLVSGVPRQITGGLLEQLLIPLIHVVLLGYLPLPAARRFRSAAFAAGCGQLMAVRRHAYFAVDGHRSIRATLHDGVKLPRLFRAGGFHTEVVDATALARCRMYDSASAVWRGLGKNATEGLAHPVAIVPWTILLLGGHVLPWLLLPVALLVPAQADAAGLLALATAVSWIPRLVGVKRFGQPWRGALLHPVGVLLLVVIQWQALWRKWRRQPAEWRGRQYAATSSVPAQSSPAT